MDDGKRKLKLRSEGEREGGKEGGRIREVKWIK